MKTAVLILFLLCAAVAGARAASASADERKVVVQARGGLAVVSAWARYGEEWREMFRTEDGFVGAKGITDKKREGDMSTPAGQFELRRAFGLSPKPDTAFPYIQIADGDEWVDDGNSAFYNQFVAASAQVARDWNSSEKLASEDVAYQYVLVIEYNTNPAVAGAGSAIFLHCSKNKPTAGCVSVPQEFMIALLEFLKPGDKIIIEPFAGAGGR